MINNVNCIKYKPLHSTYPPTNQSLLNVLTLGLGNSPNTLSPKMELVWTLLAMAWIEAAISLGRLPSSILLKAGSDSFSRPPGPPARCAGQGIPTGSEAAT